MIEIDISKLERGTHTGYVKVTRDGKTFRRKQRLGMKESEKSVEPIEISTSDLSDKMDVFTTELKSKPEGADMIAAIRRYSTLDYSVCNSCLRNNEYGNDKEIDSKIDTVSAFLKDAPKTQGTVYRSMRFDKDENEMSKFLDKCKEGESLLLEPFTSTSTEEMMARTFANKNNFNTILLNIESKNGVYLDGVSDARHEQEVLFDKNSKFKITKIDNSNVDHVIINMEEI